MSMTYLSFAVFNEMKSNRIYLDDRTSFSLAEVCTPQALSCLPWQIIFVKHRGKDFLAGQFTGCRPPNGRCHYPGLAAKMAYKCEDVSYRDDFLLDTINDQCTRRMRFSSVSSTTTRWTVQFVSRRPIRGPTIQSSKQTFCRMYRYSVAGEFL